MKSYPGSDAWWLRHTIRITLQYKNLVGHIAYQFVSEIYGLDAMALAIESLRYTKRIERFTENDCKFHYDDVNEAFNFALHDADGAEVDIGAEVYDLSNYIVALEIVSAEEYNPETGEVHRWQ